MLRVGHWLDVDLGGSGGAARRVRHLCAAEGRHVRRMRHDHVPARAIVHRLQEGERGCCQRELLLHRPYSPALVVWRSLRLSLHLALRLQIGIEKAIGVDAFHRNVAAAT